MEAQNLKCPDEPNPDFMSQVEMRLHDWMVGDSFTAEANHAYVGALILGGCALDVLAAFYRFGEKETKNESFKIFITNYLPHYNNYLVNNVYSKMRSSLVHGYSTKGFKYTDEHPESHLKKDRDGLLWIHVKSFIEEVEQATMDYLQDLPNDPILWERFKRKWAKDPLLGPIPGPESES
jgi:hypothetical protein